MSGWTTNGVPAGSLYTGSERAPFDTQAAQGASPQSISISVQKLAQLISFYGNTKDKAQVSGTRYYTQHTLGEPVLITGLSVLVGATGGTDSWILELHDSTGALVATTATAGTVAGTAGGWQQIALTTPYAALAGTYYVALQSNGTTARFASFNSPTSPLLTGSATGSFGTGAAITPPTTYTANLGPSILPY